jgi:hypothetical protein
MSSLITVTLLGVAAVSDARRDQAVRVALVTAGLSAAGGLAGALCAAAAVAVIAGAWGGVGELASGAAFRLMALAAGAGTLTGMVGAPLLGWGLLRRVPLGQAIAVTALGTVVGAVAGELLNPFNPYARAVPGVIGGAIAGFVVAGVGLRIATRRPPLSHVPVAESDVERIGLRGGR